MRQSAEPGRAAGVCSPSALRSRAPPSPWLCCAAILSARWRTQSRTWSGRWRGAWVGRRWLCASATERGWSAVPAEGGGSEVEAPADFQLTTRPHAPSACRSTTPVQPLRAVREARAGLGLRRGSMRPPQEGSRTPDMPNSRERSTAQVFLSGQQFGALQSAARLVFKGRSVAL